VKDKEIQHRASRVIETLRKLATIGVVAATGIVASPAANASVNGGTSIGDRVTKVRHAIIEVASDDSSQVLQKRGDIQVLLAQWGNSWQNWNNWNNWRDWANWLNWGNF
jgi:hypothetical protein